MEEGKTLLLGHLDVRRDPGDLLWALEGRGALEAHCVFCTCFTTFGPLRTG